MLTHFAASLPNDQISVLSIAAMLSDSDTAEDFVQLELATTPGRSSAASAV